MARSELVSYIKNNLVNGKDAMSIRSYLLSQNISSSDIDEAFDEVYGSHTSVRDNSKTKRFIGLTLVLLIVLFVGMGVRFYLYLDYSGSTETYNQVSDVVPLSEDEVKDFSNLVCDFESDDDRYDCFKSKFETNDFTCDSVVDINEREFCYVASDFYAFEA